MPADRPPGGPRIAIVATVGATLLTFLRSHAQRLAAQGYQVHAIASPSAELEEFARLTSAEAHAVPMERRIRPAADLAALWRMFWTLRAIRPDIVHTHTPKAGLLAMAAAWMLGVRARIYTVNGLVAATHRGRTRVLLLACERLACRMATQVFCVSQSLARIFVSLGLAPRSKVTVIGHGGSHGVDLVRFDPAAYSSADRTAARRELGLGEIRVVVGFTGRVALDKGIVELAEAWPLVRRACPNAQLLVCGPEESAAASIALNRAAEADPTVRRTSAHPDRMPRICSTVDVGVLPTYREGLPNALLEFGAMGIPVVATRVPGCIDVVQDGRTGLLVPPRNARALAEALIRLVGDAGLRQELGRAARELVAERFSEDTVGAGLLQRYSALLRAQANQPVGAACSDPRS